MIKAYAYLLVLAVFSSVMYSHATAMYNDCLPIKDMQTRLFKEGYAYVATGTEERYASAIQLFVDHKKRTFTVIGSDYETLSGCVLIKGNDWTPVFKYVE